MLKVNSTIEWLDVGHNRIRSKGLEAISEGILKNKTCNLKTLGIRMNFINDDGFTKFFNEVIFSGKSKIDHLYINENNFTDIKAITASDTIKEKKMTIFVDRFEKLCFNNDKRMEKTLWYNLGGISNNAQALKDARSKFISFYSKKTGLLKAPLRVKFGKKIPNKTSAQNAYMFAEFEDIRSVANVISLAAKGQILAPLRPYCSGTNTYIQIRKSQNHGN